MSEASWHDLGPADAIAVGSLRGRLLDGHRLCIGRSEAGLFVIEDTCPHAGGSLSEGMIDDDEVVCPLHAWGFDVRSGACAEVEGLVARVYETREQDGTLQVRLESR